MYPILVKRILNLFEPIKYKLLKIISAYQAVIRVYHAKYLLRSFEFLALTMLHYRVIAFSFTALSCSAMLHTIIIFYNKRLQSPYKMCASYTVIQADVM